MKSTTAIVTPQVSGSIERPTIGFARYSARELEVMLAETEATIVKYRELAGMGGGSKEAASLEYYEDCATEIRLELSDRAARAEAR